MWKRNKKIAVLGCGPAGMFAAHGLAVQGFEVTIFSNKRRSEMYGAQYLHAEIPGLTDAQTPVNMKYILLGSPEEYRAKVYGPRSGVTVSPELLAENHPAWDIRQAYFKAWDMYMGRIVHKPYINDAWLRGLFGSGEFRDVVSSLPAPTVCQESREHSFHSQEVWAVGDAPERGVWCPVTEAMPGTVILNGTRDTGWYRTANVFGYRTAEWPGGGKPPISNIARVTKPLSTDCDCFPRLVRVGRYGTWTKGVLSHEAYETAVHL